MSKFGLEKATIKERNIPFIKSPYENIDWAMMPFEEKKNLFQLYQSSPPQYWITPPKIISIEVDNYQGVIKVISNDANKIEWYLDKNKINTKYNVAGKFTTSIKVENLKGEKIHFILFGDGDKTISKTFELLPQEVL